MSADIGSMYHSDTSVDMERTAKMRIEDKISKLMCQTGACSLVLGSAGWFSVLSELSMEQGF